MDNLYDIYLRPGLGSRRGSVAYYEMIIIMIMVILMILTIISSIIILCVCIYIYIYIYQHYHTIRIRSISETSSCFWAETLPHWNPTSCQRDIHNEFVRIWDSQIEDSKIEIVETDRTIHIISTGESQGGLESLSVIISYII